ncbi:LuxR C-terminal-related transcriptional regulator [bacterium]|nr:LuxR C-terminal-related transcriptional regulator [bacterium]MBU1993105.1 LuxR C-terminal-related transcriptional regulator [bacterium]
MKLDEVELLEKIVFIQSCIIEGHNVKAILRKETSSFKEKSGADVIALCMENENYVNIELVLEEKKRFLNLMRKYKLMPRHMVLSNFMKQCNSRFTGSKKFLTIETLYDIFQGTLSKAKSLAFEQEMSFKEAKIFPLHNRLGKKIGFVVYFFVKDKKPLYDNLPDLTRVFETLILPFYDSNLRSMHSKCVQVDSRMGILTEKEKQIAHRVLHGKTHKVIASELGISINTLKTHMKNIFSKYGINSKMELHNKILGNF